MKTVVPGLVFVCIAAAAAAQPQQSPPSFVTTTGEATIEAEASKVEFWLTRTVQRDKLEAALEEAELFGARVRDALSDAEMYPNDFEGRAPVVVNVPEGTVRVEARVRFNMGRFGSTEAGPRNFGTLCTEVFGIAEQLGAEVSGPSLLARNETVVEQEALTRATENAYPAAEAIAKSLESTIVMVDSVEVESIDWNKRGPNTGSTPTIRTVSCTARVKVVYVVNVPG